MAGLWMAACLSLVSQDLPVDPWTFVQWQEACNAVEQLGDDLWPGYELRPLPLLVHAPGRGQALLGHSSPPEAFQKFTGKLPAEFVDGPLSGVWVQPASRWPGVMDTTLRLAGRMTLVVTDRAARSKAGTFGFGVMAHEGFHAHQQRRFAHPPANEMLLVEFPELDAQANAHLQLEGEALWRAVTTEEADLREEHALKFLAHRARRHAGLAGELVQFEHRNEIHEGLACYVELRTLQYFVEHGIDARCNRVFRLQAKDFEDSVTDMLWSIRSSTDRTQKMNDTTHGPASVRRRGYLLGMGQALLLDAWVPGWKTEVQDGSTLSELLSESLSNPDEEELDEIVTAELEERNFEVLVAGHRQSAAVAEKQWQAKAGPLLEGEGTLLRIKVDGWEAGDVVNPASFNPFGVIALAEHRHWFGDTAVRFDFFEDIRVTSTDPNVGILVDSGAAELWLRLPETSTTLQATLEGGGPIEVKGLQVAGPAQFDVIDTPSETELLVRLHRE